MGEDMQEEDGGVGEEGLEDASVPAGGETKQQTGEERRGKDCCYQRHFVAVPVISLSPMTSTNTGKW